MDRGTDFEQERKRLTAWAWRATATYCVLVIFLALLVVFGDDGIKTFFSMEPNEVGDVLAGFAGPLAFIWLVHGYFLQGVAIRQQGYELQQNTDALKLQADQLRLLVDAENAQKELMLESQRPHFYIEVDRWDRTGFYFSLKNLGSPVSNLEISGSAAFGNFQDRSCFSLGRGERVRFYFDFAIRLSSYEIGEEFWICIQYECANGSLESRIYDYKDETDIGFGRFTARRNINLEKQ